MEELRESRTPIPSRLLLYAVPSNGAQLANVAEHISWNHTQLQQIGLGSPNLEELNDEWERLEIERHFDVHWAVGAQDRVVARASGLPFRSKSNRSTLIADNHGSIVSPTSVTDLSYVVMKNFVIAPRHDELDAQIPVSGAIFATQFSKAADPLFDIYNPQDEIFYKQRRDDDIVARLLISGHIWVNGRSGTGKTAALRRNALISGRKLFQITLSGCDDKSETGLLRAICLQAAAISGSDLVPDINADQARLSLFLRAQMRVLCNDSLSLYLIEEIPVGDSGANADFLSMILGLILMLDGDELTASRVQLAFSSIEPPTKDIGVLSSKLRERLQSIELSPWTSTDISGLVDIIEAVSPSELTATERAQLTDAAKGSPRFIKIFYRKKRSGQADTLSFQQLLGLVEQERI